MARTWKSLDTLRATAETSLCNSYKAGASCMPRPEQGRRSPSIKTSAPATRGMNFMTCRRGNVWSAPACQQRSGNHPGKAQRSARTSAKRAASSRIAKPSLRKSLSGECAKRLRGRWKTTASRNLPTGSTGDSLARQSSRLTTGAASRRRWHSTTRDSSTPPRSSASCRWTWTKALTSAPKRQQKPSSASARRTQNTALRSTRAASDF